MWFTYSAEISYEELMMVRYGQDLNINQLVFNRVHHQVGRIFGIGFIQQVCPMFIDSSFTDM